MAKVSIIVSDTDRDSIEITLDADPPLNMVDESKATTAQHIGAELYFMCLNHVRSKAADEDGEDEE
jgi:hypothetical protein